MYLADYPAMNTLTCANRKLPNSKNMVAKPIELFYYLFTAIPKNPLFIFNSPEVSDYLQLIKISQK
jgi:hypothetical protein